MTGNQVVAGLILNSLFYSTDHNERVGLKYRTKIINALKKKLKVSQAQNVKAFNVLVDKANDTFKESWKDFPDGVEVHVPKIAYYLVHNNAELFKPFKVNLKHIQALVALMGSGTAFDSLKVANSLVRAIDDTK